jgi:thymidylate synthase
MNSGINAKRIRKARILRKVLEFELKERSCKTTQKKVAQPGAERRQEERKELVRNCKGKLMGREKRLEIFIHINIQVRNPYEHGNHARRNEGKEEGKCVVIVIGLIK